VGFTRTTATLAASAVPEVFRAALDGTGAGPVLDRATHVVHTTSTQELGWLARWLGGVGRTESVAVLAPPWLVWSTDAGKGPGTLWVALRDAEIEAFDGSRPIPPSPTLRDRGLRIFGPLGRSPERATAFLGLGPERVAEDFRDAVLAARTLARA
jgi:hypothetical protein